jgi:hypothetical protein
LFDLREMEALLARSHGRRGLKALKTAIKEIEPWRSTRTRAWSASLSLSV